LHPSRTAQLLDLSARTVHVWSPSRSVGAVAGAPLLGPPSVGHAFVHSHARAHSRGVLLDSRASPQRLCAYALLHCAQPLACPVTLFRCHTTAWQYWDATF
jgi:hypothetical protein